MIKKTRSASERLEREIEVALDPGHFVGDGACYSFVSDLEEVEDDIGTLIAETFPAPM
jgi:hypothetical protein